MFFTHIVVAKVAQECDLPQYPLGVHEIVECARDFLDGNFLTGLRVESGYHDAVRADSDGLDQLVLGINLDQHHEGAEDERVSSQVA